MEEKKEAERKGREWISQKDILRVEDKIIELEDLLESGKGSDSDRLYWSSDLLSFRKDLKEMRRKY